MHATESVENFQHDMLRTVGESIMRPIADMQMFKPGAPAKAMDCKPFHSM